MKFCDQYLMLFTGILVSAFFFNEGNGLELATRTTCPGGKCGGKKEAAPKAKEIKIDMTKGRVGDLDYAVGVINGLATFPMEFTNEYDTTWSFPRAGDGCPNTFNKVTPTSPYCIESVNDINLRTKQACFNNKCFIVETTSHECADKATQEACEGEADSKEEKADSKEEKADSKEEKADSTDDDDDDDEKEEADSKKEEEADSKKEEEADSKEEEADSKKEEEGGSTEKKGGSKEEETAAFVQLKKFGAAVNIIDVVPAWSFLDPEDFCGHAPKYNFCQGHTPTLLK